MMKNRTTTVPGWIASNGYSQCVKRLEQVYLRLKAESELLDEYDKVIRQQLQSGIIEQVSNPADIEGTHHLQHHGVVRREKLTTKLRVVFDGSAKHGDSNLSINECLKKGPNLVPHLFDVLIKFRGFPIGITSDVEKAKVDFEFQGISRADCVRSSTNG